ncbi:hypothetical protein [Streptomyces coeruleorubidus]|uniref:hypothetical protein n=1 Tax=Streptomyces coeruleorubidus TaxID=116188 RepID=UPI0036771229
MREQGRHQAQSASGTVHVVASAHPVDAQDAVVPAQVAVQVGEEQPGAAGGQLPCPVGDVGLQHQPHPGPGRQQRRLPVAPQEFAQLLQQLHDGSVTGRGDRPQGSRQGPGRVGGEQVMTYGRRGCGAYDGELLVERGREGRRPGGQEVGQGQGVAHQGREQPGVGRVELLEHGGAPADVQGVEGRGAQGAEAAHHLAQGRDREAGVGEVRGIEPEADH